MLIVVVTAAVCGAFFFMAGGPEKKAAMSAAAKPVPTSRPTPPSASTVTTSSLPVPESRQGNALPPVEVSSSAAEAKEKIIAEIDDATVLYSTAGLPKIQPYLLHADPEIRAAAIDGMVNLGETGGAALLRAASQLAPTAEDAAAMREAAAYLDLPPGQLPKLVPRSK